MDRRIDCTGADSVVTVSAVQIIITASINLMDEFIAITYLRSPVFSSLLFIPSKQWCNYFLLSHFVVKIKLCGRSLRSTTAYDCYS